MTNSHPHINFGDALIDPYYLSGNFFPSSEGWRDAEFKVNELGIFLRKYAKNFNLDLIKIADFDVIEHIPEPITFLKAIGERTKLIGLHIPLDDTWFGWLRNLPHSNLARPGHLVVLDAAASLNLLAFAGLRVQDFKFTPGFRAPSGKATKGQRALNPLRSLLYRISPYLLQKTLGGTSLMVLAQTPQGFENRKDERK